MYRVNVDPHAIFVLLPFQTVSPHLEFAQTWLCLKKDNLRHWHSPSLKFAPWLQGRNE